MEKSNKNYFDEMNLKETTELLSNKINVHIDNKALKNIKYKVFEKAGLKNKRSLYLQKRWTSIAAAVILFIFTVTFVIGPAKIANAFSSFFSFIPGIGIMEDNHDILYRILKPAESETDEYILEVNNAVASNESITVMLTLVKKGLTVDELMEEKQKAIEYQNDKQSSKSRIYIAVDNKKLKPGSSVTSGGEGIEYSEINYKYDDLIINEDKTFRVEYEYYDISCEFILTKVQKYTSPDQIGYTQVHNNISLTATSTLLNGKLNVNVYPINKTKYKIVGFSRISDEGFFKKYLHLETDKGIKNYEKIIGMRKNYKFDVSDGAGEFVLKIPYIIVESSEVKGITLPVPKNNEIKNVNKEVKFKDGIVRIISVQKVRDGNNGEMLKINIDFENYKENQILTNVKFEAADFWGNSKGGSYSGETDDDRILKHVYFSLKKNETKLKLNLYDPQYILTDEYSLKLN